MPVFEYQQRDRSGKLFQGQIEAASVREASLKLRDEGMFITSLKPAVEAKTSVMPQLQTRWRRVKLRDLLLFTKQFAVMIRAGLNLNACLNLLAEQVENPYFGEVITQTRQSIEGGEALHTALGKFPKVFPSMYIHLVEAGEASGQLDTILERLAEHYERSYALRKRIVNSLTYPCIVVIVAICAVIILMMLVVPQFIAAFQSMALELPPLTKLMIAVSGLFSNYWYLIISIVIGAILGIKFYYDMPSGRRNIDKLIYHLKIIGPVVQQYTAARFTRTFGMLLESGVTITNSLEIVERAVGNTVASDAINAARINITRGGSIASQLAATEAFKPLVTQLIAVGEETGELPGMLNEVADFYEKEAASAVEGLTRLIEPAIIVGMGVVICLIVAAIYIPIFNMANALH